MATTDRTRLREILANLKAEQGPAILAMDGGPPPTPGESLWITKVAAMDDDEKQQLRDWLSTGEINAMGLPPGMSRQFAAEIVNLLQLTSEAR